MPADSGDLMRAVCAACGVGAVFYIANFAYIACWRHISDITEMPHVRELIKCLRALSGFFLLLLIPLFWEAASNNHPIISPMTSYGNGSSWNFGWGRPVGHFALAFMGCFLDFHCAARLACVFGMVQAVVLDTLSSYDLGTQIECVESGRCALPQNHSLWGLRLLKVRDLASIALCTWVLLLIAHLSLVIGTCRTRYSFRQLHAGDHNRVSVMRTELAKRSSRPAGVPRYRQQSGSSL